MIQQDDLIADAELALTVSGELENGDSEYSFSAGANENTSYLLKTLWSQNGQIEGSTLYENSYVPVVGGSHCVTGCTNTALAQIVHYYYTEKNNQFTLTLTSDNEYTTSTNKIEIDATTANADKYGYLSFAQVNSNLEEYDSNSAEDIASLLFACGVLQESDYGVTVTGTLIGTKYLTVLDYIGFKSYKTAYNGYEKTDDPLLNNQKITETGWNVIKENIAAGNPIKLSLNKPSHDVVIDGYDAETDTVHLNYGWGKNSKKTSAGTYYTGTGWYTRTEIGKNGVDCLLYDITLDTQAPTADSIKETERTGTSVTVSASYTDDVGVWKTYYSTNSGTTWLEYTAPVTVTESTSIYFKAQDKAKNTSVQSKYDVVIGENVITITAASGEKKYDGTAFTLNEYTYTGLIKDGDELVVTVSGSITDAGDTANQVTDYKVMRSGADVTSEYKFNDSVAGKLTVTQRNVIMTSASDSKVYNGSPLTNSEVTVSGDGFAGGEGATYSVTGTQTEIGSSANTFTYSLNEGTKTGNYNITKVEGTLTVLSPQKAIHYLDENGTVQTINSYTLVTGSDFTWGDDGKDGWYVVEGDVSVESGYVVSGNVKLIVLDGKSLTVTGAAGKAGISVSGTGNSFSIYAGSTGDTVKGTGTVTANGGTKSAGIGGSENTAGNNITINGGIVNATGGTRASGIGGGYKGSGTNITVNGGVVTANGAENGAGIGGGQEGNGSYITINGGSVTATSVKGYGAGIGGGCYGGQGTNITINGGIVNASSKTSAAGIGGGFQGAGSAITITGGTVTAAGGNNGAGIGNGAEVKTASGITITGGTVTATGGVYAAGIGGGEAGSTGVYNDYSDITISGGVVNATGVAAAGIGGGRKGAGTNIKITGGTVNAASTQYLVHKAGDAIGNGADHATASSNITVSTDLTVKADNSNPPTTVITNTGSDLASQLAGKQYALVKSSCNDLISASSLGEQGGVVFTVDSTVTTSAAEGKTVTVTAVPVEGYTFAGFTSDQVTIDANNQFVMPAGSVTVTANYKDIVNGYAVSYKWSGLKDGTAVTLDGKSYVIGQSAFSTANLLIKSCETLESSGIVIEGGNGKTKAYNKSDVVTFKQPVNLTVINGQANFQATNRGLEFKSGTSSVSGDILTFSMSVSSGATLDLKNASVTADGLDSIKAYSGTMWNSGTVSMGYQTSLTTVKTFNNSGSITVDMTGATLDKYVLIDGGEGSNFGTYSMEEGKANGYILKVDEENNDLYATRLFFVNSAWTSGQEVNVTYDGFTYAGTVGDGLFSSDESAAPEGKKKVYVGARDASEGGSTVRTGNYANQVSGGYRLNKDSEQSGSCELTIDGDFYNKSVNGGDTLTVNGTLTRDGSIGFTIDDGEFRQRVAGGMFYNPSTQAGQTGDDVTLDGDITMIINGGVFHDRVFGGNNATMDAMGEYATVIGNINLTVDTTVNKVVFDECLIAGSRGDGYVRSDDDTSAKGNTSITFTGSGDNLTFAEGSVVWGGCSGDSVKVTGDDREQQSKVTGTRTLAFNGFTGSFDAQALLFTDIQFSGNSEVNFSDAKIDLQDIEVWNFAAGSTAELNSAVNDFTDDELNITGNGTEKLTLLTADNANVFANFDKFDSVAWSDCGTVKYNETLGVWTDGTSQLALEENEGKWSMTLSAVVPA